MKVSCVSFNTNIASKKNSKPSFKAPTVIINEKNLEVLSNRTNANFFDLLLLSQSVEKLLKKFPSDDLKFIIQPKKESSFNINVYIKDYKTGVKLAEKYSDMLTEKEVKDVRLNNYTNYYMNKGLLFYKRKMDGTFNVFHYKCQETTDEILESIKKILSKTREELVFVDLVRKKHTGFVRILEWLDTHGPDFMPIN